MFNDFRRTPLKPDFETRNFVETFIDASQNMHLSRDIQQILKNPQHDHSEGAKARTKQKRREEEKHTEVNRSHQELEEELLGRAEVAKGVPRDPQGAPKTTYMRATRVLDHCAIPYPWGICRCTVEHLIGAEYYFVP